MNIFSSSLLLLRDIILFVSQQHLKPGSSWNKLLICFSVSMQKREICVPKVYTLRKDYFTYFHIQLYSCGNTPFTVCLKHLSWYYFCDYHRVDRLLWQQQKLLEGLSRDGVQGSSCQPAVPGTGPLHKETGPAGKPREKWWKGEEGLMYFTQTWQVCLQRRREWLWDPKLKNHLDSFKIKAWYKGKIYLSYFLFFFFQVERFSRSLPYFKQNISFECD